MYVYSDCELILKYILICSHQIVYVFSCTLLNGKFNSKIQWFELNWFESNK